MKKKKNLEDLEDIEMTSESEENTETAVYDMDGFSPVDEPAEDSDDGNTEVFTPIPTKKNKAGKLSLKQWLIIAAVFIIYTVVLLTAAWLIFYRPSTGAGGTPFDTKPGQMNKAQQSDEQTTEDQDGGETYVENGRQYNILLVGHDKLAYLADVTMLVSVDTKYNTVSVMQIPRDTYVSTDVYTGKINATFSTYYSIARGEKAEDPYLEALNDYASLLEKNLCINIHHVAIMNLDGFKNIVNALGGVDVYVPNAMYYEDPEQELYIDIPAGEQHLDGAAAEGFVRFRSGYVQADLGRVNAQKIFMTAFFNKLKSTIKSVDVATLNSLLDEVEKNVHTDLSVSDLLYFAKTALKIDLDKITMMTAPGSVSGMYYVINRQATLKAINDYFNVYNKDISDAIFDRNSTFCDLSNSYMSAVYNDSPENILDGEYTADSIDEDSIYIARTQSWVPTNDYYYDPVEDSTDDEFVPEINEDNVTEDVDTDGDDTDGETLEDTDGSDEYDAAEDGEDKFTETDLEEIPAEPEESGENSEPDEYTEYPDNTETELTEEYNGQ